MEFKLSFTPAAPRVQLSYHSPLLLTGSCFSEHISSLLQQHAFNVVSQPNGVVFNPVSIAQHIERAIKNEPYREDELHLHNELWHSWQHHGSFNGTDKAVVLNRMNAMLTEAHQQLMKPGCIVMITLGSGYVYELDNKEAVANCHKYPQQQFTKRLLTVNEIIAAFEQVIRMAGHATFYFTVSPVRHVRDGLVENNLGKSVLLQAVHELCKLYESCYYFPAYEIVIDELRDYRFYNSDLVHPNEQAVDYVWKKFVDTCMDERSKDLVRDMAALNAMLHHKILHEHTDAHRKFEESKEKKITELEARYHIRVSRK